MAVYAVWKRDSWRLGVRGSRSRACSGVAQFCLNFNFVYRAEQHITSGLVSVVFAMLLIPNAVLGRIFLGQKLGPSVDDRVGDRDGGNRIAVPARGASRSAWAVASDGGGRRSPCAACCRHRPPTSCRRRRPRRDTRWGQCWRWRCWPARRSTHCSRSPLSAPPVVEIARPIGSACSTSASSRSALAFPLYFGVLRTIGPAKAAYSSVIVPVIAMLLSTLFEGYRWSGLAMAGAALAAVGTGDRAEGAQAQPVIGVKRPPAEHALRLAVRDAAVLGMECARGGRKRFQRNDRRRIDAEQARWRIRSPHPAARASHRRDYRRPAARRIRR